MGERKGHGEEGKGREGREEERERRGGRGKGDELGIG